MESPTETRSILNRSFPGRLAIVAAVGAVIIAVLFLIRLNNGSSVDPELNMPKDYAYSSTIASNRMELHVIRTRPSNVTLAAIRNNVTISPYYGVNGGFFYDQALLSMAVVDGVPANGMSAGFGSGAQNVKYPRGTLVWDGASDRLSVQVARAQSELAVSDRTRYWAQGGISMSLGEDDRWLDRIVAENAPFPYEDRLRTAAVYDREGNLYLVVSANKGTLYDFREAIVERVGDGKLENGIFLDGDGSSQLRSRERKLKGDGRPVVQMLALIR